MLYQKRCRSVPIRGRGKWPAAAGKEGLEEVLVGEASSLPFFSFRRNKKPEKKRKKKKTLEGSKSFFQATAIPEGPGAYQAHAGGDEDENACEEERAIGAEEGAEVAGL